MSTNDEKIVLKKSSLFKIGLILFPVSFVINILFVKLQVHGLLREFSRMGALIGFLLIIFGGIYNLVKK